MVSLKTQETFLGHFSPEKLLLVSNFLLEFISHFLEILNATKLFCILLFSDQLFFFLKSRSDQNKWPFFSA